jgi:poly(A) polymerase Pap1
VLQLLQRVTVEFVQVVSRKKGLSPAAVEASGGKIFTYGSYRLGVYGPGKCSAMYESCRVRTDDDGLQAPISIR